MLSPASGHREPDSACGFFNSDLIRWQVKSVFTYKTGTKLYTLSVLICIVFFFLGTECIALIKRRKPFQNCRVELLRCWVSIVFYRRRKIKNPGGSS